MIDLKKPFDAPKGAAILSIALVMAIYAKITGNTRPFTLFSIGVSLAFIIFVVNYMLGKLNS